MRNSFDHLVGVQQEAHLIGERGTATGAIGGKLGLVELDLVADGGKWNGSRLSSGMVGVARRVAWTGWLQHAIQ